MLTKRAVAHLKDSIYLDALAGAFFVNCKRLMAIETAGQVLALARDNKDCCKSQQKKFGVSWWAQLSGQLIVAVSSLFSKTSFFR